MTSAAIRCVPRREDNGDWASLGYDIPLLVNLQPAGEYLGEEYHRATELPCIGDGRQSGTQAPPRF